MKRRFNNRQRLALYLAGNGKCSGCGDALVAGWHADHIQPYSVGGATDVINGQAMCGPCNLKKGSKTLELRTWQANALEALSRHRLKDFLLEATPGAGKTLLALADAKRRLDSQEVSQIIVVSPTGRLTQQWKDKAHESSIDLELGWALDPTMHGSSVTYQWLERNAEIVRKSVYQRPTMVVLDELHHMADGQGWGRTAIAAFDRAVFRLALSGTPFRSDSIPIPFVQYVNDIAQADVTYGYGEAVADGVCRPVFFPRMGGRAEWSWAGQVHSHSFDDALDEEQASRRLNTALRTGEWLPTLIEQANAKLSQLRQEHPNAGGLIICIDAEHARNVCKQVETVTGDKPTLAISQEPLANEAIERFAGSKARWLVAIKMVSEGIDIPRLRVGVYATNVKTELFFRQAVGRVIRSTPELDDDTAHFYIPDDGDLREYASRIKEEREHQLTASLEKELEDIDRAGRCDQGLLNFFNPLDSVAETSGSTFDSVEYSQAEMERAADLARQHGLLKLNVQPEQIASLLRQAALMESPLAPTTPMESPSVPTIAVARPKTDRKKSLRKANQNIANRIVGETGLEHPQVQTELNRQVGVKTIGQASEEQLEKRLSYGNSWLQRAKNE